MSITIEDMSGLNNKRDICPTSTYTKCSFGQMISFEQNWMKNKLMRWERGKGIHATVGYFDGRKNNLKSISVNK
jgi:hypothetical protein